MTPQKKNGTNPKNSVILSDDRINVNNDSFNSSSFSNTPTQNQLKISLNSVFFGNNSEDHTINNNISNNSTPNSNSNNNNNDTTNSNTVALNIKDIESTRIEIDIDDNHSNNNNNSNDNKAN